MVLFLIFFNLNSINERLCNDFGLFDVYRSVTPLNLMESWLHLPKWVSQILYSDPVRLEGKELGSHYV